jgi:hypothetical protein
VFGIGAIVADVENFKRGDETVLDLKFSQR